MDFSLLYFANREVTDPPAEYDLLFATAKFADDHGFRALWLPERHFHPFGGAYPNPALAAAAVAVHTRRIRLRAGSVVMPLHDPLTVVEDWAFVDNLSLGRVDLALATGWRADDFVLAPDRYADRRRCTFDSIDTVRSLWAGQTVRRRNGHGVDTDVRVYPRPVQEQPGLWLTGSANVETFVEAGARGLHILTALLFQRVEELAPKITAYRQARERNGHDPATGVVTVMVHTLAGESDDQVRSLVRTPFTEYLRSSADLWRDEWSGLASVDATTLVDFAFERYFRQSSLFGSVATCVAFAESLAAVGVDEIASLIDFGLPGATILAQLPYLDQVRRTLTGSGMSISERRPGAPV
jgi:natural product biosynthesis luciferase-like monooxygenase protein